MIISSVRTNPLNLSDRLFLTGGKLGLQQNMDNTRMERLTLSSKYYDYFRKLLDVRINDLSSFVILTFFHLKYLNPGKYAYNNSNYY